jgi:hypothetical protein
MNYSRALENMPVADALVAGATIFNEEVEIDSASTNVDKLGSACEAWQELSSTSHWYTLKECSSGCILRLKQPKEPRAGSSGCGRGSLAHTLTMWLTLCGGLHV